MRRMYNDKELQSQYRSRAMVRASDYDVSRVVKEFNKVLLD
jgi:hypothetical protein